jgi:hypothetical protein
MILCEISDRMLVRGEYGDGWADVADATAVSQAIERIEKLSAALARYGKHLHVCETNMPLPREPGVVYEYPADWVAWRAKQKCTCGLESALIEATK